MASPDLFCAHCGAANAAMATTCFNCGSSLSQDDPLLIQTGTTSHTSSVSSSPTITITGQLAHDHLLQGRYRILKQIGTGGFGAVYEAQDLRRNDAPVAIKSINLHHLSPEQIIEATDTFNREVGMLSELEHPNLPRIYERFTDREHWYLVMDFIEGETLEEYLDHSRQGYLPVEEVLTIGVQLCSVLDYLHSRQPPIIFRDVKPGNIMRTSSGHLYLIDFGIARHFRPGQARDTMPLGSPGYAPPEQYGKAQTTVQSDIYSLGATLQTLLTGKDPLEPPFGSASPYAEDQEVPVELQLLLVQMLAREVDKRPASIASVKQRLLQIKRDQQQQAAHSAAYARSSPPPHTPTSASSSSRPAAKQKMLFWSPLSSPPLRVLIALIVIFLLYLSVALSYRVGSDITSSFRSGPGESDLKPISFSVGAHPTIIISNAFSNTDIHAGSAKSVTINPTQNNGSFGIAPQINYSQDGNTITVTVEGPESVNLDVTVPNNADLQVETNSGDIDVTGVSGQMSLSSNGGAINATNDALSGQSTLSTTTGSVTFNGSIDPHGTYLFGSTSGSVDVTLPGNSSFHVDATAGTGSISSAFPEVKVSGAEAHGDVGSPPRATVTLSAGSSINLNKA